MEAITTQVIATTMYHSDNVSVAHAFPSGTIPELVLSLLGCARWVRVAVAMREALVRSAAACGDVAFADGFVCHVYVQVLEDVGAGLRCGVATAGWSAGLVRFAGQHGRRFGVELCGDTGVCRPVARYKMHDRESMLRVLAEGGARGVGVACLVAAYPDAYRDLESLLSGPSSRLFSVEGKVWAKPTLMSSTRHSLIRRSRPLVDGTTRRPRV